jgi:two-component system sensor histidine kinase CpxA
MMPKRGIFIQTFIWFWIVMTAIVATLSITHEMTDTTHWETRMQEVAVAPLIFFGPIAVERYEQAGAQGLTDVISRLKSSAPIDVYLFNKGGSELTGRPAPPEALALSARTGSDGKVAVTSADEEGFAAVRVTGAQGRSYVVVGVIPRRALLGAAQERSSWIIRLIAVLIVSSIACYLLSRYMTTPIVKLREATRRLASGDVTVRVAPAVGARRDEIGELARDFDVMAGRVEALLTSQRQLLGNISHELRSPLSRLGVALELAGRHSSSEAGRYLGRIELEAERLNELIGGLLAFTRLESGIWEAKRESFDLAEVVAEVAADADFEAQAASKTVRVTQSTACVVSGARELIRSAVENVTRNAVRYTREGTEVEIAIRRAHDTVVPTAIITIRDHGPGVPESDLDKLFRPFYRVGEGRDRQTGGRGLGLAITERAVLLHGGTVKASNAPDDGLIVEITIPQDKTGALP